MGTTLLPRYRGEGKPSVYLEPKPRYRIGFHRTLDVGEATSGDPHAAELPFVRMPLRPSIYYALEQYEGRGEVLM
jgi:hypothetical protein